MSLPTPKYHKHENVYPPSEDTFVLLDALEKDIPKQVQQWKEQAKEGRSNLRKSVFACEVGVGSGVCSVFLDGLLRKLGEQEGFEITPIFLGIDVNPDALSNTKSNIKLNETHQATKMVHDHVLMSLFKGVRQRGMFDIVLFNPPYVVTSDTEVMQAQTAKNIQTALDGGKDGRRVIDLFLESVREFVASKGIVYLVLVNENGVLEIEDKMKKEGWGVERVLYRVCGWEGLHVVKFVKE